MYNILEVANLSVKFKSKKDTFDAVKDIPTSAAVTADGYVYIGVNHGSGNVYCLDENNGEKLWEFKLNANIGNPPAIGDNDYLYVIRYFTEV